MFIKISEQPSLYNDLEKKSVREELKQEKAAEKAQDRRREKVKVQDRGVEL